MVGEDGEIRIAGDPDTGVFHGDGCMLGVGNCFSCGPRRSDQGGENFPVPGGRLNPMGVRRMQQGFNEGERMGKGGGSIGEPGVRGNAEKSAHHQWGEPEGVGLPDARFKFFPKIPVVCLIFPVGVDQDIDIEKDHES